MMYFIVVYYKIRDIATIRKIQERFKFPKCMTVNGEWQVLVEGTDWETLRETERRGYIEIRNKAIRNMKATNLFIKRIEEYLKKEADTDLEFAKKMQEQPEKTPEAVCNYILSEVSKKKQSGWADEEIYGMAKHFIDEKELKDPGSKANNVSRVVVDTHVELSEEEKQKAMEKAQQNYEKKLEEREKKRQEEQREREKKAKEKRLQAAKEKQEKEAAMMGDLFGGQY